VEHVWGVVFAFAIIGAIVWGAVWLVRAGGRQQARMRGGLMQQLGIEELSKSQMNRLDLPSLPSWAAAGIFLGRDVVVSEWVELGMGKRADSFCGVRVRSKRHSEFRLEIRPLRGGGTVNEQLSEVSPGDLGLDDLWSVRSSDAVLAKQIVPNDEMDLLRRVLTHPDSPRLMVAKTTVSGHEDSPDISTEALAVEVRVPVSLQGGRGLEQLLHGAAVLGCAMADRLDELS